VLLWNNRPLLPNSHQAEGLMPDILLSMDLFKPGEPFKDAFDDHPEADSAMPNIVAHNLTNTEACLMDGQSQN
jgi:hypothetical protein